MDDSITQLFVFCGIDFIVFAFLLLKRPFANRRVFYQTQEAFICTKGSIFSLPRGTIESCGSQYLRD